MILEALLVSSLGAAPAPAFKCPQTLHLPGYPQGTAVVVVDGELIPPDPDFGLLDLPVDLDDVEAIEVACWSPEADGTGAKEGVPFIAVFTRTLREATRAEIEEGAEAMRGYVTTHGALPGSLADLDLGDAAGERLAYDRSDEGWRLTTVGTRADHCTGSGAGAEEPEIECDVSLDLAEVNLRAAYAREG